MKLIRERLRGTIFYDYFLLIKRYLFHLTNFVEIELNQRNVLVILVFVSDVWKESHAKRQIMHLVI